VRQCLQRSRLTCRRSKGIIAGKYFNAMSMVMFATMPSQSLAGDGFPTQTKSQPIIQQRTQHKMPRNPKPQLEYRK